MYADDLILISISLKYMQSIVDLCSSEFEYIGMNINIKKSGCIRIGSRHNKEVSNFCINNQPLKWLQEIKYLGIQLPMKLLVDVRKLNEHDKIIMNINHPMHNICTLMANNEFHSICTRYNITVLNPKRKGNLYRDLIWTFFE